MEDTYELVPDNVTAIQWDGTDEGAVKVSRWADNAGWVRGPITGHLKLVIDIDDDDNEPTQIDLRPGWWLIHRTNISDQSRPTWEPISDGVFAGKYRSAPADQVPSATDMFRSGHL